jgi:hypothetical protein
MTADKTHTAGNSRRSAASPQDRIPPAATFGSFCRFQGKKNEPEISGSHRCPHQTQPRPQTLSLRNTVVTDNILLD